MLIDSTQKLAEVCSAIKNSGAPLCFDTEFASERRYRPALFLVQIGAASLASSGGEYSVEAIVDPLRVSLDPFLELVADAQIEKVLHSGSQDLQILWERFGCAAHNVFDTQIAAAFLGFGNQIGYADLAKRTGGAGELSHLSEGIARGHADAVLCASIFHYGKHTVREAKERMSGAGIPVRR